MNSTEQKLTMEGKQKMKVWTKTIEKNVECEPIMYFEHFKSNLRNDFPDESYKNDPLKK